MNEIDLEFRLRQLGAVTYNIKLPETKAILKAIKAGEEINGVIWGKYSRSMLSETLAGRGALIVTNNRVILIDKKPMFSKVDEIAFRVISGISYSKAGVAGTVVLNTRLGDIHVRTLNKKCVDNFIKAVEAILSDNVNYTP
ncbi:MAG TPA: PH domain-containing protein [Candidatus Saccharimonadales bacterium]